MAKAKTKKATDSSGERLPAGAYARLRARPMRFTKKDSADRLAISRDGSRIAVKIGDLELRIWNARTGALLHEKIVCKPHGGAGKRIENVLLSPDGSLVAAAVYNHVLVFNVESGTLQHEIRGSFGDPILFTFDGSAILLPPGHGDPMRIVDLKTGEVRARDETHIGIGMIALTGDGRRLLVQHAGGIAVHDARTLECEKNVSLDLGGSSGVAGLLCVGENELLLCRHQASESLFVDLTTGARRRFEWPRPGSLYSLVGNPDGTMVCVSRHDENKSTCEVLDLRSREVHEVATDAGHAAFADTRLALANPAMVRLFDTTTWSELLSDGGGHTLAIDAVRFEPAGLVTYGKDSTRTWHPRTGEALAVTEPTKPPPLAGAHGITVRRPYDAGTYSVKVFRGDEELFTRKPGGRPTAAAVSPTGALVAYTNWDGYLCMLDALTGKTVWLFQAPTRNKVMQPLMTLAWSPDGSRIAAGGHAKFLGVFDALTGQQRIGLDGHTANVLNVAFPSGNKLLFSRDRHTTRIWNAESGESLGTLKGLWPDAWSPDGTVAATIENTTVVLWEPSRALPSQALAVL